jgi:hypothetical protein
MQLEALVHQQQSSYLLKILQKTPILPIILRDNVNNLTSHIIKEFL